MVTKLLAVLAVLACSGAELGAELKVISKVEVRKTATSEPPNPLLAMIGGAVARQVEQMNGAQTTTTIGTGVIRTEADRAIGAVPLGTVVIMRSDGSMVGVNHADKTFFRSSAPDLARLAPELKPTISVNRTGEFSAMLGHRVERVLVDLRIALPIPPEAMTQLPPGFPTHIDMTMENWTADAYKTYGAQMIRGNPALSALGMAELADIGFAMRQIVRSALLGGFEMETTVTSVGEVTPPAGFFEVPEGFKEVPPPGGLGRGRGTGLGARD